MKVDLLDGNWANLRDDVERIPNRERRKVMAQWDAAEGGDIAKGTALCDSLIALFVTEWSFDEPLPRDNLDVLGDLAGHDYDVLSHHAVELQGKLFLNFSPSPDPASPTGPSNG